MKDERLKWFKEQVDYSKMLDHTHYGDMDEFVVNRYGDIITYRVYGNSPETFTLCVR